MEVVNEQALFLFKVIEIILIASVKFLFAPFEAERQGFGFTHSLIITTSGGIIGIIAFTYISTALNKIWKKFLSLFSSDSGKQMDLKKKRKFTWRNKFIIGIKVKFGLTGIALITPCIISIPFGTIAANNFYRNRRKVFWALITSLVFWSLLLNYFAFHLHLSHWIKG